MHPTTPAGPLTPNALGALLGIAPVPAGWFVRRDLRERGHRPEDALWLVGAAGVGGLAGAKAWYVVTDPGAPSSRAPA